MSMNLINLLKQIECIVRALKTQEPGFTGSLRIDTHWRDGEPKDVVRIRDSKRIKLT